MADGRPEPPLRHPDILHYEERLRMLPGKCSARLNY
jgi:hypothetical protein